MKFKNIIPDQKIALFVKSILVFENKDSSANTVLPFFADGYPGIMYQETEKGLYVSPHNKKMPDLFLYGQTLHPIELLINGSYKLIIFQLYPFVLKTLPGITPRELNDDCFDLGLLKQYKVNETTRQIRNAGNISKQIKILSSFLYYIFQAKREQIDYKIRQSIQLIITHAGKLPIKVLREKLKISERTFERRFIIQAGVSPKQFSKIVQFQLSLNQLTSKEYAKLTDIVFDNGFADQSHFIRTFKSYTGKTPKKFKQK